MKAVVTSKGQVTIPHSIRQKAKITTGSQLDFQIESDGVIIIRTNNKPITRLKGIVKFKGKKPISVKQMKMAVQMGAEESMK